MKTPCLFYFRRVQFHCVQKKTHMMEIVVVFQHKKDNERNLSQDLLTTGKYRLELESAGAALCKVQLMVCVTLAFQKLLQTRQTSRNNNKELTIKKEVLVMIKHYLGNSQIITRYQTKEFSYIIFLYREQTQQQRGKISFIHSDPKNSPCPSVQSTEEKPWFLFPALFPPITVKNPQENLATLIYHLITQPDNIHPRHVRGSARIEQFSFECRKVIAHFGKE